MTDVQKPDDPTLRLATHVGAVVAGAIAGFLTEKLGIAVDPATQAAVGAGVAALASTLVHYVQARVYHEVSK